MNRYDISAITVLAIVWIAIASLVWPAIYDTITTTHYDVFPEVNECERYPYGNC